MRLGPQLLHVQNLVEIRS